MLCPLLLDGCLPDLIRRSSIEKWGMEGDERWSGCWNKAVGGWGGGVARLGTRGEGGGGEVAQSICSLIWRSQVAFSRMGRALEGAAMGCWGRRGLRCYCVTDAFRSRLGEADSQGEGGEGGICSLI